MEKPNIIYSKHNIDVIASKIPASTIRYYDLTIVLRGELEYVVNKSPVTLRTGSVMCLKPDTVRGRLDGEKPADYISFNFTTDTEISLPTLLEQAVSAELLLLIGAYDELRRHSYPDSREKIEHLLACIVLSLEDKVKQKSYNPLTLKIMEYIHTNLSEKITLSDIGKITFFSPIYCDTVFKKETGKSIIDYLIDARITEAKLLLIDEARPLGDVAELVGFDDYNYFSRTFKKRTGYTPGEYRRFSSAE